MEIEKDEVFSLAERYVEGTGVSVFLTGKAGTGKTTFLKHITAATSKRFVVLAPTGVAAINAGGVTIHSFFQLPLCPYLPDVKELVTEYQMPEKYRSLRRERVKILRTLDLLIIDEISMVRADLLDAVDATLRRYRRNDRPFGGVQLLMIGDAQQLSPVVTESERPFISQVYPSPYFFHSKALQRLKYVTIELRKVHRQKDADFLEILNAIRENRTTPEILRSLNSRVGRCPQSEQEPIRLTTHNRQADEINTKRLEALPGSPVSFQAEVEGDFPENSYPVEETLLLKKGAQVMFTRNDSEGEYYNGKLAKVVDIRKDGTVIVEDEDHRPIAVEQETWENIQYSLDEESGEVRQTVVGTFKQLPLRAAWAITIHKSQGLTFDRVIIDAGAAFAFGQVYVALSRCRSLEGITLESPIRQSSIYSDVDVSQFNAAIPETETVRTMLSAEERHFIFEQLRELFDLERMLRLLGSARKTWFQYLDRLYEAESQGLRNRFNKLADVKQVADRFREQLTYIEKTGGSEEYMNERAVKAAAYFMPELEEIQNYCIRASSLEVDNKEVKKRVKDEFDELLEQMDIVQRTLSSITSNGKFSTEEYGRIKVDCLLDDRKRRRKLRKVLTSQGEASTSVDKELHDRILEWRSKTFKEENVPAYTILPLETALAIATLKPKTRDELLEIKGFGPARCRKYGDAILAIVNDTVQKECPAVPEKVQKN